MSYKIIIEDIGSEWIVESLEEVDEFVDSVDNFVPLEVAEKIKSRDDLTYVEI